MKTALDPRHQRREKTVQEIFAWGFNPGQTGGKLAKEVITHLPELDKLITESASQWPLTQINRIDLSILRLAVYELMVARSEPVKVIIDEAVELAKEFGSQSSPAFVNGVLGNILKKEANES